MAIDKVRTALRGISGVHVTPYGADGAPDYAVMKRIVARIAAAGIHNIVSAGNTGEYFTLTPDEIANTHATSAEAAGGRTLVTAGIGRSLVEAIAQAKAAAAAGCDAVMVHFPNDPFAAPIAQAAYFLEIAEASPLPVVAYVRSDAIPVAAMVKVASHANVAGVKYAASNMMQLAELIRASQGTTATWVCGLAEGWAAPFYALGARGFTSGLVNVDPARSLAILAALDRGDMADAQRRVTEIAPFEHLRTKHANGTNVTVVKEAMEILGWSVGPVRSPGLPRLEAADRAQLETLIAGWGLVPAAAAAAE
jgi:4-hydroxy-tetrahydrodipicolinate synthase